MYDALEMEAGDGGKLRHCEKCSVSTAKQSTELAAC